MTFAAMIEKMSPEIYTALKSGVELGRWPNGQALTQEQKEISMEAVLRYEAQSNIPEEERVGYIAPKKKKLATNEEAPVKILGQE
ncbi:YeaC family protein [Marinospirillum insulare]|uniref:DUF1315 family protein n=1 Tax=Marinospirillum insulare TaxID=217169 RepID=A0ABQ5ZSQ9_9GAMM|nr:DUF1315 family protein [Marinospirillum insulare]GLR63004.1 hypothetical protein GCM10007878_04390 [Marinospirillum insulare]